MKNILVLGDSQAKVFSYCNKKTNKTIFDVVQVGGATAIGSVNPNSKTNALNIFTGKLKKSNNNNYLGKK
jgi:hypothetical protein